MGAAGRFPRGLRASLCDGRRWCKRLTGRSCSSRGGTWMRETALKQRPSWLARAGARRRSRRLGVVPRAMPRAALAYRRPSPRHSRTTALARPDDGTSAACSVQRPSRREARGQPSMAQSGVLGSLTGDRPLARGRLGRAGARSPALCEQFAGGRVRARARGG